MAFNLFIMEDEMLLMSKNGLRGVRFTFVECPVFPTNSNFCFLDDSDRL